VFTKATKSSIKLRMAISGPSGSGKTRTALEIAKHFGSGKIALADTEDGKSEMYSNHVPFDMVNIKPPYSPTVLGQIIDGAGQAGYDTLVFDSLTAFWKGQGGLLELIDEYAKAKCGGNTYAAYKKYDPIYQKHVVERILRAPLNIIVTLRAKTKHEMVEENGKKVVKKFGMEPEFRDDFQYNMDLEGMMTMDHDLIIGKNRFDSLDGRVFNKPGKELAELILKELAV
jgi:hypothetical protein